MASKHYVEVAILNPGRIKSNCGPYSVHFKAEKLFASLREAGGAQGNLCACQDYAAVEMPRSEYMATRDASDDVSVRCARTRSRGLFNATSLYIALRESSEYVAATCVPWLRINVVIFRQSRGESPVSSLLVKWPRIFLIVSWLPTEGRGFFNMIYMYHWIYTCFA